MHLSRSYAPWVPLLAVFRRAAIQCIYLSIVHLQLTPQFIIPWNILIGSLLTLLRDIALFEYLSVGSVLRLIGMIINQVLLMSRTSAYSNLSRVSHKCPNGKQPSCIRCWVAPFY